MLEKNIKGVEYGTNTSGVNWMCNLYNGIHISQLAQGFVYELEGIEINIKKESPRKVELVEVIHVVIAIGKGTKDDPVHLVNQYWSKEGELLAEKE